MGLGTGPGTVCPELARRRSGCMSAVMSAFRRKADLFAHLSWITRQLTANERIWIGPDVTSARVVHVPCGIGRVRMIVRRINVRDVVAVRRPPPVGIMRSLARGRCERVVVCCARVPVRDGRDVLQPGR